ncbi:MAG: hypothetical protein NTX61_10925 [Bacteroidetes bacterium]|nr:hypothetical protein [Bacteroidota bacterium]
MHKKYLHALYLSLFFLSLLSLTSCDKFSGDQTIPAYLKVDSIYLVSKPSQGTASHNITDAWIYVDDQLIGIFELPARVPVLKQGKHKVRVDAGIKKNGIAATRADYVFYDPVIIEQVNFVPDSTTSLGTLHTIYSTAAQFLGMENFENAGMILDTTPRSLVGINRTAFGSDLTFEGLHSGSIVMDTTTKHNEFECVTQGNYTIPLAPVYLEMNFNTNMAFTIGVVIYVSLSIVQYPVITLNPTNGQWKKIYIELTNSLNTYAGANTFKVYLRATDSSVPAAQILIDNIKILTN